MCEKADGFIWRTFIKIGSGFLLKSPRRISGIKKFFLGAVVSLSLSTASAQDNVYDFLVAVRYCEGPTSNFIWERALFRKGRETFYQQRGTDGLTYQRSIEENEYRSLVKRLTENGLLKIKGGKRKEYSGAYYRVTVVSGMCCREIFYYPDTSECNENSGIVYIIREMRNSGVYFSPSN